MTYRQKLESTRARYPFNNWRGLFYPDPEDDEGGGMEQYAPENCDRAEAILNWLIESLAVAGEQTKEADKVTLFKIAVRELNKLNIEVPGLIETGEREDLCELFDEIALAAGLVPGNYGRGDGIATEWRNW